MQAQKQQVIVTKTECPNVQMLVIRTYCPSIGIASANSAKFRGIRPRMHIVDYFDNADYNVTLRLYNVTLTSQKPF